MNGQSLAEQMQDLTKELMESVNEMKVMAKQYARSEYQYKVALRKEIL